jgi:hypothetical protein
VTDRAPSTRKRGLRRRTRFALLAAATLGAGAIALAFAVSATLTRAAPSWWINPTADAATEARATALENAAVSQLYLARDAAKNPTPEDARWSSEPWSVALDETDVNAWLAARLPKWVEGQPGMPAWPETMSQLQIRLESGAIRAGVRVETETGNAPRNARNADYRFITASFVPVVDADGSLWLTASWVHMGRLPVPAAWVIGDAGASNGILPPELTGRPEAALFVGIAQGEAPFATTPVLALENNRRVRLLGIRVRDGRLELTMRTEVVATVH